MDQLIPMILIFGIFYFVVIRPQQQKQKELKEMIAQLKEYDEVVTTSGLHGKVDSVKETTVVLKVDSNIRLEFDKESIGFVKNKEKKSS